MRTIVGLTRSATLAACALLAGCGGSQPPGAMPQSSSITAHAVHGIPAPASATRGIYVGFALATGENVLGYPQTNRKNKGPICTDGKFPTPSVHERRNQKAAQQRSHSKPGHQRPLILRVSPFYPQPGSSRY
jgi:hypothetical protein